MKTIVVGYDGTEPADRALERAAELAKVFGSKLIVTWVAPVEDEVGPAEELDRARTLLSEQGLAVEYQPAIGEPADALVEVAERYGAELLVVGTRDPGAIQRMLGQSVSQAVLRQARCNVLVVRR